MPTNTIHRNPFTFRSGDIVPEPFPYIVKESFIDPDLYQRLKREYPGDEIFDQSSSIGARAGRDLYWGDADYDSFISASPAWREFHDYMNSSKFVDLILNLFGDQLIRFQCYTDPNVAKFVNHVEPREELKSLSRIGRKVREIMIKLSAGKHANELAVRMDLGQAGIGYYKSIHCDRPNRLITMIVYFCDADELGAVGGDLMIHELINKESKKSYSEYQRHPKEEHTQVIATIRPKENLGIIFPCTNNSYHSVSRIETQKGYRNFIYCSVYGIGKSVWKIKR